MNHPTAGFDVLQPHDLYSLDAFVDRVRERFESRADILAATSGDHRLNPDYDPATWDRTFKPAAVLIAAVNRPQGANILLTQRADTLNNHSGQIAFPGGKIDDGETAIDAALREAEEEIGLDRSHVKVLGEMGTYFSGSGYSIAPVIALVNGEPELTRNEDEVADIFEVPLRVLMDRDNLVQESRFWQEKERFYYVLNHLDSNVEPSVERRIWGVTAGIISTVQERLYGG